MSVMKAAERMRAEVDYVASMESVGVVVKVDDLDALLNSHEALRLAGEKLLANHPGGLQGQWRALSLAVEEASK